MFHFHKSWRGIRRFLSSTLACACALALLSPLTSQDRALAAGADEPAACIHVGLYYGTSARTTCNLANADGIGSGYTFGYYTQDDTFVPLGTTAEEFITVGMDTNLYLAGRDYYATPTSSGYTAIGAYHVQLPGSYTSFEQARSAAASYGGFPAYVDGTFRARVGSYTTSAQAQAAAASYGGTAVGASPTCQTVMVTETGKILFEFDNGGDALGIEALFPGGKAETYVTGGYRYYGGFAFDRPSGGSLRVVNVVDEDDYVAGVLPYEMSVTWPEEALKAGAVAARTFARVTTKHSGFDVCTSTCCQVYHGVYSSTQVGRATAEAVAAATSGECVYYDGKLTEWLMYYASDGGATESGVNYAGTSVPYLIGKPDPYDDVSINPYYDWSYTITAGEVKDWLNRMGYSCGNIVSVAVTEYTDMGNVNAVTITDASGDTFNFRRDNVRSLATVNNSIQYFSRRFTITPEGETPQASPAPVTGTAGSFTVYDGETISEPESIYAITASGTEPVTGNVNVITANGIQSISAGSTGGTAPAAPSTKTASSWVISGSGNGHNIGMSQWGAYNMATQGFTYIDILQFYYTGVTVA